MGSSSPRHSAWWLTGQIAFFLFAIAGLTMAPPARGRMVLVPMVAGLPVARLAIDRGALIVARGRGGTIVVRGDAAQLVGPLLHAGILTLAAWPADCGAAWPTT